MSIIEESMGPYMRRLHDKQRSPFKKEQKLSFCLFKMETEHPHYRFQEQEFNTKKQNTNVSPAVNYHKIKST